MESKAGEPVFWEPTSANAGGGGGDDKPGEPLSDGLKREIAQHWVAGGEPAEIGVSGNSMWPFLRDGDTVLVEPGGAGVVPGDIVVYFLGEALLIHRAVRTSRSPEGCLVSTKGDFALSPDPGMVGERDLVGKAVAVKRGHTRINLRAGPMKRLGSFAAAFSYAIGVTLGRLPPASKRPGVSDWRHLLILAAVCFAIYANSIPGSLIPGR